ncbi:hypothetical protein [Endozoicomonas sp. Mp262]|uniref:hypothetical protein n=1 Tax=Endozoicomonas sp. Mp262 TaxID=2919499 RepID=UPI0021D983AE
MTVSCDMYFAMNFYRLGKIIYFSGVRLLVFYIRLKTSIKWVKIHLLLGGAFILAYSGFVLATVDEDLNEVIRLLEGGKVSEVNAFLLNLPVTVQHETIFWSVMYEGWVYQNVLELWKMKYEIKTFELYISNRNT